MPMTAEQAKAAVTEGVMGSLAQVTGMLANAMAAGDAAASAKATEDFESHIAHLRQVEAVAHRVIDKAFESPKEEAEPTESDDDYRKRLTRVVGAGSVHYARLQIAVGRDLDDIGANYDTKRK